MTLGLGGNLVVFAVAFALISLGVSVITTVGHNWIGSEIPASERGRIMGFFETSWAFALLIGAPIAGLLIRGFEWWTPFALIGAIAALLTVQVARVIPARTASAAAPVEATRSPRPSLRGFGRHAWLVLLTGLVLAFGAVITFASFGAWLKDSYGFTTATVAGLSFALGVAELAGSGGVAVLGDRLGLHRSVVVGAVVMAVAAVGVLAAAMTSRTSLLAQILVATAAAGVFLGFEFAFVANLTLVSSESGLDGDRRGAFIGMDHALSTAMRAFSAVFGTAVYDRWSMRPIAVATLASACVAVILMRAAQRVRR
jgi:MFS transporter, DHA1 family, inner membrane transport protein